MSLNLGMNKDRKREVATTSATPSDVQGSPSRKRWRDENGDEANSWKGKEDVPYKVFNDSVHGHIEIHPLCVKIIDTPQYQRLRNIKQNGGCYHVFPGASHNRFEHGIGTCHLSGMLVKSLKERQEELDITDEDILCVQIAGLCHDLGHGPFSHMFDALFIPTARPESHWKHEVASVRMFDHMMEVNNLLPTFATYNLADRDVTFIKELILGAPFEENSAKKWSYTGRGHEKSFLYEIVANKRTGIDVDKFDYFARDCHHLGISNSFDHKRYMKFVRVIDVDVEVEGMRQICVQDKEVHNLYDMFHTRKSLFRRAYQHKTSNIIEKMITEALLKADKTIRLSGSHGKMLSISESIDDMEAYSQLSDAIYYEILRSTDPALKEARDILLRIEKRDLYKCIGSTILKKPREKNEIPYIQQEIASSIEEGPELDAKDFVIDLVTFDYGMGDRNPIDEVRFYQKNNPDKPIIYRKEGVSNMLPENFRDQEMRIYFRKNDPESLKKAERCFYQWCKGQECTPPKGRHDSVDFTPLKLKDQTLILSKGRCLDFDDSAQP